MSKKVYFVKPVGLDGPIKIGYSAVPQERLEALAVWSPWPLEIVATVPGDSKLETKLHRHFAASHSHHEWFHSTPELRKLLSKLRRGIQLREAIEFSDQGPIRNPCDWYTEEHRRRTSYRTRVRHASRRAGRWANCAPERIEAILQRWSGNKHQGIEPQGPTPKEIEILEAYIASPEPDDERGRALRASHERRMAERENAA